MKNLIKRFRFMGEKNTEWLIIPTAGIEKNGEPFMNPCIVLSIKWLHLSGGIVFYYQRDFNPSSVTLLGLY